MSFEKKTVYHSALVTAGTIRITVTSAVLESKFKKEGTPNVFVGFTHDGTEHQYIAETLTCADVLAQYKGEEITIKATGSRADARIEVLNTDGKPAQQPQQRAAVAPQQAQGAGNGHGAAVDPLAAYSNARKLVAQEMVLYGICLDAAAKLMETRPALQAGGRVEDAQTLKDLATTLFIRTERENFNVHGLPSKTPDASAAKPAPVQRQPEPEPPAPENDAAADSDIPW